MLADTLPILRARNVFSCCGGIAPIVVDFLQLETTYDPLLTLAKGHVGDGAGGGGPTATPAWSAPDSV